MSHRNLVVLHGNFYVIQSGLVEFEGKEYSELEAEVHTGPASIGEVHRVNLMSETAEIAKAFVDANGGDGMRVTISGKLYSTKGNSRVIADWISFYVPDYVANKSKIILEKKGISQRGTWFTS
jgi:hypothetical protein